MNNPVNPRQLIECAATLYKYNKLDVAQIAQILRVDVKKIRELQQTDLWKSLQGTDVSELKHDGEVWRQQTLSLVENLSELTQELCSIYASALEQLKDNAATQENFDYMKALADFKTTPLTGLIKTLDNQWDRLTGINELLEFLDKQNENQD